MNATVERRAGRRLGPLSERRSQQITWLIVGLIFVIAAIYSRASGDRLSYPDERTYNRLAHSLLEGEGYVNAEGRPTAFRPPGWPVVLSVIYQFWDRPLAAKIFNAAALAGAALFLSLMVAHVVPESRAVAPLLLLGYPLALHTSSTLYPQAWGMLLLTVVVWRLSRPSRNPTTAWSAGLLLGILILAIPAFLLVIPWVLIALLGIDRQSMLRWVGHSALLVLGVVMVVAPWSLRNARAFDKFIPVSTNSGLNLLYGNSEDARPNSGVNVNVDRYRPEVRGLNEAEADGRLRQLALQWIRENPASAARLYLLKVLNYFNFRNELYVKAEQSRWKEIVVFLTYYPLLAVAMIRLGLWRRLPLSPTEIMLYVLYFGNALTSAVFFTRIRFRVPFDALLIAIVAIAIGYGTRQWLEGTRS